MIGGAVQTLYQSQKQLLTKNAVMRQAAQRIVLNQNNSQLTSYNHRYFSTEVEKKKGAYQTTANSWGTEWTAECWKFEKEWEQIADKINAENKKELENELSPAQVERVNFLMDYVMKLSKDERLYMKILLKDKLLATTNMNITNLNVQWPAFRAEERGTWPANNPNWFSGFGSGASMSTGGGSSATAAKDTKVEEAKPKEEEQKEKSHYDVELTKFDPAKKIALIKEVRGILALGLKEAKELVESAPQWIKKELKKEEAEKLVEKLKELGAECRLA
eukprot:403366991